MASAPHSITLEERITVVCVHVRADVRTLGNAIGDVAAIDRTGRRTSVLEVGLDPTLSEIERIATHAKNPWSMRSKSAFVADDHATFGLGRPHEVFRSVPDHENRTFRDESEAIAWLREPFEG